MSFRKFLHAFFICFILFGCSSNSGVIDTLSGGDSSDISTSETSDDENSPSEKLDVPESKPYTPIDPDDPIAETCNNMDILFVIDNSGSMSEEQAALIENFNVFANKLNILIEELDSVHVGVITSDDFILNTEGCNTIGSLVTRNGELVECGPYYDGYNFMTENDDLVSSFSCAANVGISGSGSEKVLEASIQALEGFLNSVGQCNEGFNREKTLTTIIYITDEDTNADIEQIYDHLLYLEKDEKNINIVAITHVGTLENCEDGSWMTESEELIKFAKMFPNHKIIDICNNKWDLVLSSAVDSIASACGRLPGPPTPAL